MDAELKLLEAFREMLDASDGQLVAVGVGVKEWVEGKEPELMVEYYWQDDEDEEMAVEWEALAELHPKSKYVS